MRSLSFLRKENSETEKGTKSSDKILSYTLLSLSLSLSFALRPQKDQRKTNRNYIILLPVRPDPQVEPALQPVRQRTLQPQRAHGRVDPQADADAGAGPRLPPSARRVPGHRGARVEVRSHVGEQAPLQGPAADGQREEELGGGLRERSARSQGPLPVAPHGVGAAQREGLVRGEVAEDGSCRCFREGLEGGGGRQGKVATERERGEKGEFF